MEAMKVGDMEGQRSGHCAAIRASMGISGSRPGGTSGIKSRAMAATRMRKSCSDQVDQLSMVKQERHPEASLPASQP